MVTSRISDKKICGSRAINSGIGCAIDFWEVPKLSNVVNYQECVVRGGDAPIVSTELETVASIAPREERMSHSLDKGNDLSWSSSTR